MCLVLSDNSQKIIKDCKKKGKPILGYKILITPSFYSDMPPDILYHSYWRDTKWKKNLTNKHVSDRKTTKLTEIEKNCKNVYKGFHFYRTREIARKRRDGGRGGYSKIVQFEIDPKDLVAFGDSDWVGSEYNPTEFVATRCKMIKEVR